MPYRLANAGRREQDDRTTARHAVLGLEGVAAGWDYVATLTHSANRQAKLLRRGHLRNTPVLDALRCGVIDTSLPAGGSHARESYRKTASPLAQGIGDSRFLEDADIVP